ncbi:Tn3 family transposase [Fluviispira multicolorata]|uniref:Tn3 family transposase n=1 Tax=Fluviispira multicolorata TaxID=2654512 RepID=A0A833JHN7_9BACT|nr:Tn3 family transposase [Fluviispira multicolorata]KAB8033613.1 Tn3 family transposase [Fluviispira multicolorata]
MQYRTDKNQDKLYYPANLEMSENVRVEQEKAIKYNHLLANIFIFYNVFSMSKAFKDLIH